MFIVCVCVCRMNPAAQPLPVQDVQGDARWISQVKLELLTEYLDSQ